MSAGSQVSTPKASDIPSCRDGVKNLLLIPYLIQVADQLPRATAARFASARIRIGIDLFRDYPTHRLALGTGQTLNLAMTVLGAMLLIRSRLRRLGRLQPRPTPLVASTVRDAWAARSVRYQQLIFASVLLFCLTIPSNWTQDIPARYGKRHAGLQHSKLYPSLDTSPPSAVVDPLERSP
jgi:hypothetical protein